MLTFDSRETGSLTRIERGGSYWVTKEHSFIRAVSRVNIRAFKAKNQVISMLLAQLEEAI
jgi:hypothetical protein